MDLDGPPQDLSGRLEAVHERIVDACRAFGVRCLGVFGSYPRGELHPHSDIDLCVELSDATVEDALYVELTSILGTDRVQLVNLDRASDLLLRDIAVEGRLVYEAEPGAFVRRQVAGLGRYMETSHLRRLRRELLRTT